MSVLIGAEDDEPPPFDGDREKAWKDSIDLLIENQKKLKPEPKEELK